MPLDETTAALAVLEARGFSEGDARSSVSAMLRHLSSLTDQAALELRELGVSVRDGSGSVIGLLHLAASLQQALAHFTLEQRCSTLATIFGSDAVRAATVLCHKAHPRPTHPA